MSALATGARAAAAQAEPPVDMPQPTWVLPEPLKLATRGERPLYQGVLHLLAGPHRVEGGWWHRTARAANRRTRHVAARLLGRAERARRRAVDLPDAAGERRDRLVPARGVRLSDAPAIGSAICPTTPNCAASATSASCAARASPRSWSSAPSNWATARWRSPTSARWPASCAPTLRPSSIELKLLVGSQFRVDWGIASSADTTPFDLTVLACNLNGYGNLCEFITKLRRSAPKGTYHLDICDISGGRTCRLRGAGLAECA